MVTNLRTALDEHLSEPFPPSVEKGSEYGGIDCVMVGSDIYGWSMQIAQGKSLRADDRARFETLKNELVAALPAFPAEARSYYERLVELADLALRS